MIQLFRNNWFFANLCLFWLRRSSEFGSANFWMSTTYFWSKFRRKWLFWYFSLIFLLLLPFSSIFWRNWPFQMVSARTFWFFLHPAYFQGVFSDCFPFWWWHILECGTASFQILTTYFQQKWLFWYFSLIFLLFFPFFVNFLTVDEIIDSNKWIGAMETRKMEDEKSFSRKFLLW